MLPVAPCSPLVCGLRAVESGASGHEGVDCEHQGAVGFDGRDGRLERPGSAVGDEDLLAEPGRTFFLPAAGRDGRSTAPDRCKGQLSHDLGYLCHAGHRVGPASDATVRRGSNARRTASNRSLTLARSWLLSDLVRMAYSAAPGG